MEGDFRESFENRVFAGRLIITDEELGQRQRALEAAFAELIDNVEDIPLLH